MTTIPKPYNTPVPMTRRLAHLVSWILSPLLIPSYATMAALWLTPMAALSLRLRWQVTGSVWLITCVIPILAILLMFSMKVISDPALGNRRERFIPYTLTSLCYIVATWYLWRIHAPEWMWMFMTAGAAATITSCLINRWWKISAHMAAMAGLTALILRMSLDHLASSALNPELTIAILLTGLLGTCRILLGCHTFWQVTAGAANGFLWVILLT